MSNQRINVVELSPELEQGISGSMPEESNENDYQTGTVKWFSTDKAYGFISVDDGSFDIFVHAKQLKASGINKALKEGEKLRFKTEKGHKGHFAVDISYVS